MQWYIDDAGEALKMGLGEGQTFASLLKRFRMKAALTQEELAQLADLVPKTISAYETGERRPGIKSARALEDALQLSEDDLVVFRAALAEQGYSGDGTGLEHSETRRNPHDSDRLAGHYLVGRQTELHLFDALLSGTAPYTLLNIYGPGGIGKSVVRRMLAKHARTLATPVATIDCADPNLTPDQILAGFQQSLIEGSHREYLEPILRSFGDQYRDYHIINRVLLDAGGVNALFDTLGNVKDPNGLRVALESVGGRVTHTAERTLHKRFALERYLRSANRSLTVSFLQGLALAGEQLGRPLALMMDTYEELEDSPSESWVCRDLVPALPPTTRMIILGRNALHRVSFDWHEHGEAVALHALPELGVDEAKAYLTHYGLVDPTLLNQIYAFTGGYPLLLMLVRYFAQEAGGWDRIDLLDGSADRDYIATQLLGRILREERVQEVRVALEKGAVARWLDPGAIAALLQVPDDHARTIYDKLRHHSFVERHPHGIRFHDKIRELLENRLKFTNATEYSRLKAHIEAYYRARSGGFRTPLDSSSGTEAST
ncbi:MAG: helix-turn-helix domain-containing protein [Ktedonobacterales bacterium]